ncbi:MAG: hypothetical protein KAX49_13990 [Halanaerobiales bacterium]|nr:hypothetical protein [Halanaerobiales bacterium]
MIEIKNCSVDPFFEVRIDEEQNIYIPLSRVFELLELYLFEINWKGEFITGLIPTDNSYYYFDLKTGQMKQNEKIFHAKTDQYFVENEEIYIFYEVLNNWLPVEAEWDDFEFQMTIRPKFKLVSQLLEERKEIREEYFKKNQTVVKDVQKAQRSIFNPGVFTYQTNVTGNLKGIEVSGLDITYAGQLLYGDLTSGVEVLANGKLKIDDFKLRYNNIPMLSNVVIGSSFLDFPPLLRGTKAIKGITFANQDAKYKFGEVTLNGSVPTDSEVELYNRGALISFQKAEDGTFNFSDVDIQGAFNAFDIIVYTPEGRILRKKQYVLSKDEQLSQGKFTYFGGLGKSKDGIFVSCKGIYGLNQRLSVGSSLEYFEEDEKKEKYIGGEMIYKFRSSTIFNLETHFNLTGKGCAYLGEVQSAYKSYAFYLGLLGYYDIFPTPREVVKINNELLGLKYKVLAEILKSGSRRNINLRYQLDNFDDYYRHQFETNYSYRISLQSDLQLQNIFNIGFDKEWRNMVKGSFSYSGGQLMNVDVNGDVTFRKNGFKDPNLTIHLINKKNSQSQLNYSLSSRLGIDKLKLSADVQYDISNANLKLTMYYEKKKLNFAVGIQYKIFDSMLLKGSVSKNSVSFSLSLTELRKSKWPFEKIERGSLNTAWVEGLVYLDINGNSKWDEGEKTFPNVSILVDNHSKGSTDEEGRYVIQGLYSGQEISLGVDATTIDALYIPIDEKIWVELCPASGMQLDFGVVPCSGLSGYLIGDDNLIKDLSGSIAVVLINEEGEEVYRCYPECDGFYVIEQVLPGTYTLTVKFPEDMDELSFQPLTYTVEMPCGEIPEWFDGMDFHID